MQDTRVHDGMVGEGVGFERIRRITGYLVGTMVIQRQRPWLTAMVGQGRFCMSKVS